MEETTPSPGEPARHVVLVGLMGSGKTTVGRILAGRLGRRLRDSDAEIQASGAGPSARSATPPGRWRCTISRRRSCSRRSQRRART